MEKKEKEKVPIAEVQKRKESGLGDCSTEMKKRKLYSQPPAPTTYPVQTLSPEYSRRYSIIESHMTKLLSVTCLGGKDYVWLPGATITRWFAHYTPDFFHLLVLDDVEKMTDELTALLRNVPIRYVYIAAINMFDWFDSHPGPVVFSSKKSFDTISAQYPKCKVILAAIDENEKKKTLVEETDDPVQRMLQKNHKSIDAIIKTKREKKLITSDAEYQEFFDLHNHVEKETLSHQFEAVPTASLSSSNPTPNTVAHIRRKKRTTWNIIAYVVIIGETLHEVDTKSTQIVNEISTMGTYTEKIACLVSNAKKSLLPCWVASSTLKTFELDLKTLYYGV